MTNNQIEVVFREELRGRNALHFWIGLSTLLLAVYLWWHGWFSAFVIDMNLAPEPLQNSYAARSGGYSAVGGGGMGSTGAISILFDTFCLIGWGVTVLLVLMRKFLSAVLERFGFVTTGLYAWASQQNTSQTLQPAPSNDVKSLEARVSKAVRNHEDRLRIVEAKTSTIPEPEPPPPPKTTEEILAEQAAMIQQLKEALDASTDATTPAVKRRTTKKEET